MTAITAAAVALWIYHYLGADPIFALGGGWDSPDVQSVRDSHAADWTQMTVPARPGARQGFVAFATNPSSVTQTILGLAEPDIGMQERLQVSVDPGLRPQFHSTPVEVPPGSMALLRLTFRVGCIQQGGTVGFTVLMLRVRVGIFTRTETVPLNNLEMAVGGTRASQAMCPGAGVSWRGAGLAGRRSASQAYAAVPAAGAGPAGPQVRPG